MSNDRLNEKPNYYAIIPANVRYDKALSANAKLLYGEITCLLNFNNKCFASNNYFGRLYDISDVQVSRLIKQLLEAGYIETSIEITHKGTIRLIKLTLNKNDNTPNNKNDKGGINKNVKLNNNRYNNNTSSKEEDNLLFNDNKLDDFIKEFNTVRKAKKPFTAIAIVKKQFTARIKEGFKNADLITALKNAMLTTHNIENSFSDLTPEFITRQDKLEKYLNYTPKTNGEAATGPTIVF